MVDTGTLTVIWVSRFDFLLVVTSKLVTVESDTFEFDITKPSIKYQKRAAWVPLIRVNSDKLSGF